MVPDDSCCLCIEHNKIQYQQTAWVCDRKNIRIFIHISLAERASRQT